MVTLYGDPVPLKCEGGSIWNTKEASFSHVKSKDTASWEETGLSTFNWIGRTLLQ